MFSTRGVVLIVLLLSWLALPGVYSWISCYLLLSTPMLVALVRNINICWYALLLAVYSCLYTIVNFFQLLLVLEYLTLILFIFFLSACLVRQPALKFKFYKTFIFYYVVSFCISIIYLLVLCGSTVFEFYYINDLSIILYYNFCLMCKLGFFFFFFWKQQFFVTLNFDLQFLYFICFYIPLSCWYGFFLYSCVFLFYMQYNLLYCCGLLLCCSMCWLQQVLKFNIFIIFSSLLNFNCYLLLV